MTEAAIRIEKSGKLTFTCILCQWKKTSRSDDVLQKHLLGHLKGDWNGALKPGSLTTGRICHWKNRDGTICKVSVSGICQQYQLGSVSSFSIQRLWAEHRYHHVIQDLASLFMENVPYFEQQEMKRYCMECFTFFANPADAQ